jgi:hypothetical protein
MGQRMKRRRGGAQRQSSFQVLERGTVEELIATKKSTKDLLALHWALYSALAYQRGRIDPELRQALAESCKHDFEFDKWQRVVTYKYSLDPLSMKGSITGVGGRFNMGELVNPNLPRFPALYVASDRATAMLERFGPRRPDGADLSGLDLALTAKDSVSIVAVSGRLERYLDIGDGASLKPFVDLIKGFKLPQHVRQMARKRGEPSPEIVRTPAKLVESLLASNWRASPMLLDVPANSQIFGHIAYEAGIDGIVYPSVRGDGECVAVFPRSFEKTESFVELADNPPREDARRRIDATNCTEFC